MSWSARPILASAAQWLCMVLLFSGCTGGTGVAAAPPAWAEQLTLQLPDAPWLAAGKDAAPAPRRRTRLEQPVALPFAFEANRGQADARVAFLARAPGSTFYLTGAEAVLVLEPQGTAADVSRPPPTVLRLTLEGAHPGPRVEGLDALPGRVSYFLGNDRAKWRSDIPTYARVAVREVYPGVDVVYYGNHGRLEYDFVVAPGADPGVIALRFTGADDLVLDADGGLRVSAGAAKVHQQRPQAYQEVDGEKREVSSRYLLRGEGRVGIELAAYDAERPLVIDPLLAYSTYLGGSGDDFGCAITTDANENVYIAGWTSSPNFPIAGDPPQPDLAGDRDAFVAKVDASGGFLDYATYVGGEDTEFEVIYIDLDPEGNAYVTGATKSPDFPTTPGAFQTEHQGLVDAFVFKLDPTGSELLYSTLIGGEGLENGQVIDVGEDGSATISGFTGSTDFPTTPGAFQTENRGGAEAFVARLAPDGSDLVFSTYLGGSGSEFAAPGMQVGPDGSIYVTGSTTSTDFPVTPTGFQRFSRGGIDAFVTRLSADASSLIFSTYLGGSLRDEGRSVEVDANGNVDVMGETESPNFFVLYGGAQSLFGGASDIFFSRLSATGSALLYSTFVGGSGAEVPRHMARDTAGNVFATGATSSPDFPVTDDALQRSWAGGEDVFVTKLAAGGREILFSTFLGGTGNDRARAMTVDPFGDVYIIGFTSSADFPTEIPLQSGYGGGGFENCFFPGGCDAFLARISEIAPLVVFLGAPQTQVVAGSPFPFTIELSNRSDAPQFGAFALELVIAGGPVMPLLPPQDFGLPPRVSVVLEPAIFIPAGVPTGEWTLRASLGEKWGYYFDVLEQHEFVFTVD